MSASHDPQFHIITLPQSRVALPTLLLPPIVCPYLSDRASKSRIVCLCTPDADDYQELMDLRFRRSGEVFYRPECDECAACVPIRVPVAEFRASRSQRRVWRRNADVHAEFAAPAYSDELYELYERYQEVVHDGVMSASRDGFREMFCESPIDTLALYLRVDGRVIGYGVVDVCPRSLSSVYFFYDPALRERSLGVFSALLELEECRRRALPYWYIGYYVADCRKMEYKRQFEPYELLGADGEWRRENT